MANKLLNLYAESGANIIDDDTDATLELENTSTGIALRAKNSSTGAAFSATNTTGVAPAISIPAVIGAATVAPLAIGLSAASGPAIQLVGRAFTSALSGGSVTGAIRVKVGDNYYWVPVMREMGGLGA